MQAVLAVSSTTSYIKETSKVGDRCFVVIRHGESVSNIKHVLSSSDTPLNPLTETGRNQVQTSAEAIIRVIKPDVIITSQLQRAKDTAGIVAQVAGISAETTIVDPRLREPYFGSYEEQPAKKYIELFVNGTRNFREGTYTEGSPDGESGKDQEARINALMDELIANPHYAGKTIVLATHLYPFQHINKYLTGEYVPDGHIHLPNASWCLYKPTRT